MLQAINKGKAEIEKIETVHLVPKKIINDEIKKFDSIAEEISTEINIFLHSNEVNRDLVKKIIRFQAVSIERKLYDKLFAQRVISEQVYRELKLQTEISHDRIKLGQEIELKILSLSIGFKIKRLLYLFCKVFMPNSGIIRNAELSFYIVRYEISIARAAAYSYVSDVINNMPKLNNVYTDLIDECCNFYHKRMELAVIEREKIEENISIDTLFKQTIHRVEAYAEKETFDELAACGSIADSIIDNLNTDIHNRIDSLSDSWLYQSDKFK